MNKNVKKMIVMLGIVLGSTAMAITVQLGVWGWVPIELYTEYRDECESIPHAYWYENDMGSFRWYFVCSWNLYLFSGVYD